MIIILFDEIRYENYIITGGQEDGLIKIYDGRSGANNVMTISLRTARGIPGYSSLLFFIIHSF